MQEIQEIRGTPETRVLLVHRDLQESGENQDPKEKLEILDPKDHWVPQVLRVFQEISECLD